MKKIPLTRGKEAWISDIDYQRVSKFKWFSQKSHFGYSAVSTINGKMTLMHRLILNAPEGVQVDHRDGNELDNRRFNIRICTQAENQHNRRPNLNTTSQYKGVYWDRLNKKWRVQITTNGKRKYLGLFDNEHDAARKYNVAAKKYFGNFARLNVIVEAGENYQLFA